MNIDLGESSLTERCRRALRFALVFILLPLTACMSTIHTQVNTFKSPLMQPVGGSIYVHALRPELEPSLEFAHFGNILAKHLTGLGYDLSSNAEGAEFVALLDYDVSEAEDENERRAWLMESYGSGMRFGPRSGLVVVNQQKSSRYNRKVILVIAKNDPAQTRLYEVKAQSEGRCAVLSKVFEPMIEAMLHNFPAEDGGLMNVKIPGDERC